MKNYLYLLISTLFIVYSCSVEDTLCQESKSDIQKYFISKEAALDIADKVLGTHVSNRSISGNPDVEYVTRDNEFSPSTRSLTDISDTLAYVINYPNESGFVIVSSSSHVYPVLAYSNEGNFSFSNEVSKTNFIDNIGAYLEEADINASYSVGDNDIDGCYMISPMVKTCLNQRSPWDKYVIEEHPGCPVGCVAVATALVMTHSKYSLSYHGTNFPFKSIVDAIANEEEETSGDNALSPKRIGGLVVFPPVLPEYSYEQAVDSMAKLLYWIGKDVNMDYGINESDAASSDAYSLCVNLGFTIPSGYANFDILELTQYLSDGHIVYIRGRDYKKNAGHAWVSDGCNYCVGLDGTTIVDTYIHCDWGLGGNCNGYYSGSVFSASSYNFTPQNYFAVRRDWQ